MPELRHNEINEHLRKEAGKGKLPAAYIIFGEEMLCKQVFAAVLEDLLPESERILKHEPFDGGEASLFDVLERVNTYSLMSAAKVVSLQHARLFDASQDPAQFAEKAAEAWDQKNPKKAAALFMRFLAAAGIPLEDAAGEDYAAVTEVLRKGVSGAERIAELADHCRLNGMKVPVVRDEGTAFLRALEKGFPQGHYLLVTTDVMDRRKKIYKELKKVAVLVNCTVPKGDRQADRVEQQKVLADSIRRNLAEAGKTLDGDAFRQMIDLIGFDLRTFVNSVDKLIAFVGERGRITSADVHALLRRTKKDPIYEISNAVADRRTGRVLNLVDDLLEEKNSHPLMVLAMLVNQIRRLLLVKGFLQETGGGWRNGMSFNQFKTEVFPVVRSRDEELLALLSGWQEELSAKTGDGGGRRRKKPKSGATIIRGGGSPYPVYQLFVKAQKFSTRELRRALADLAEVDIRMKSGGGNPRMLLEKAVINVLAGEEGR